MTDEERKAKEKEAISTAINHLVPIQKVAIEELTATQNDTYTAPSGKAYTPVTVNVSGGGSSDFSGAEVTIVTAINEVEMDITYVDGEAFDIPYEHYTSYYYMEASMSPATLTVPLYKGKASCLIMGAYTISVSGSASISEMNVITITGDCTITIS